MQDNLYLLNSIKAFKILRFASERKGYKCHGLLFASCYVTVAQLKVIRQLGPETIQVVLFDSSPPTN